MNVRLYWKNFKLPFNNSFFFYLFITFSDSLSASNLLTRSIRSPFWNSLLIVSPSRTPSPQSTTWVRETCRNPMSQGCNDLCYFTQDLLIYFPKALVESCKFQHNKITFKLRRFCWWVISRFLQPTDALEIYWHLWNKADTNHFTAFSNDWTVVSFCRR